MMFFAVLAVYALSIRKGQLIKIHFCGMLGRFQFILHTTVLKPIRSRFGVSISPEAIAAAPAIPEIFKLISEKQKIWQLTTLPKLNKS